MSNDVSGLDEARECRAKDPNRALEIANRHITENPMDSHGYFSRHLTWMHLGEYNKALDDCNRSLELSSHPAAYRCRSEIYRRLGDHARAVADQNYLHDAHYERWLTSFGPHLRADSLARLGRLDEALADCARIRDDHWMPAHDGLPGGDKQQFIAEIKRRAAAAVKR